MIKQNQKWEQTGSILIVIISAILLLALAGAVSWRILKTRDSSSNEQNRSGGNTTTWVRLKTEGGCATSDIKCGTYTFEGTEYTVSREGSAPLKGTLPDDIAADLAAGAQQKPDQEGTKATCVSFVDGTDYTAEISYKDIVTTQDTCFANLDPRNNSDPTQKYRYSYSSEFLKAFDRAFAFIHQPE